MCDRRVALQSSLLTSRCVYRSHAVGEMTNNGELPKIGYCVHRALWSIMHSVVEKIATSITASITVFGAICRIKISYVSLHASNPRCSSSYVSGEPSHYQHL